MDLVKKLTLPIVFTVIAILFIVQYFAGDSPSYGEGIKILLFLIPFLFVLGGSHAPIRRKILLLIPVGGIVLLQFSDLMIFVQKWYFTVPWLGWFIYYLSRGYSDTMHLANEFRPKSVELNQASEKDTKGIPYFSKPTMKAKKRSFWGFLGGYIELALTGFGYATVCAPLCLVVGTNIWHALLWGLVYGSVFSILGFVFHKYLAKPLRMDKWGWWEMSAGICVLISIALAF